MKFFSFSIFACVFANASSASIRQSRQTLQKLSPEKFQSPNRGFSDGFAMFNYFHDGQNIGYPYHGPASMIGPDNFRPNWSNDNVRPGNNMQGNNKPGNKRPGNRPNGNRKPGNKKPQTTSPATRVATSSTTESTSTSTTFHLAPEDCDCPFTPQFNPVCGTDGNTYKNSALLRCFQRCGVDVSQRRMGSC